MVYDVNNVCLIKSFTTNKKTELRLAYALYDYSLRIRNVKTCAAAGRSHWHVCAHAILKIITFLHG